MTIMRDDDDDDDDDDDADADDDDGDIDNDDECYWTTNIMTMMIVMIHDDEQYHS